jgi:hypothetical protein
MAPRMRRHDHHRALAGQAFLIDDSIEGNPVELADAVVGGLPSLTAVAGGAQSHSPWCALPAPHFVMQRLRCCPP